MKSLSACLLMVVLGASAVAQSLSRSSSVGSQPAARATLDGIVTKDPGGEAVKKALIELIAENQVEGGDYTATTGPDGTFHIEGILPGRYRLFAERTGFTEAGKRAAREGRVITLTAGQELREVQIRLSAGAVVRGRVTDEDGDPLAEAEVAVLRRTYIAGHSRWEQVGAERSNDLGEFRIANLGAGNYYVSVSPPPDFKSLIAAAGAGSEARNANAEKSSTSYQTTYYPGTADRNQAAPIQLRAGDEFPVNFSLTPSPSLSIRGAVVNLPRGATASVLLQSRDFNLVLNGADMRKDGTFVIHDVSPGSYTILATVEGGPTSLMARQTVQVGGSDLDGLRLAPQAGSTVRGRLRLESRGNVGKFDPGQLFLALRPADGSDDVLGLAQTAMGEAFSESAHVAPDGTFEWTNVPAGNYFVLFEGENGANGDWYLKSASAGGRDVNELGISVNGGLAALDVVASNNGALVDGVVTDPKGEPVTNAVVVVVPEARLRGRVERYRRTVSDQSGRFMLRGIPPGDYTIFAWESVDGEAYYNPEFLKSYEGQGSALHAGEGERKSVKLLSIPAGEELQ